MALYVVVDENEALAAATAETLIQVVAGAGSRLKIKGLGLSFDGVTASAVPGDVTLLRQTTAGTASALTPRPLDDADPAATFAAQNDFTVEPTDSHKLWVAHISPNSTGVFYDFADGREPIVPASGRLGLKVTFAAIVNVTSYLYVEGV